jgi:hypothetical protein
MIYAYRRTIGASLADVPTHAVREERGRTWEGDGIGFTVVTACGKTLKHAHKGASGYREIVTCGSCQRSAIYTEGWRE